MPRAGLTPAALVDAAAAIANADGLPAVTLARLAGHFGVRPPSLYKHVPGLDAIHVALAVRGTSEAARRIQQATVGRSRDDALFALAHAYWQFARDEPGLYAASLRPHSLHGGAPPQSGLRPAASRPPPASSPAARSPAARSPALISGLPGERDLARAGEALVGTLLAVLAGYGPRYASRGDDALHATRGLRAIIHGFVSLDASGGFRLGRDPKESFDRLLSAFAHDLAARGG
jgi:AcrR family transcriptional regulator